jgi:hypothetical protein
MEDFAIMNETEQMEMNADIRTVDRQESRRQDFEQKMVYNVLLSGGVFRQVRQFKAEQLEQTGSSQLTLEWLRQRFPDFPIRLGATLLPDSKSPPWIDIFEKFTTTAFFRAYRQWCKDQKIDDHREHVGLVFNLDATSLVLHNLVDTAKPSRVQVVRTLGKPPVTFVIEELGVLLGRIGDGWAQKMTEDREGVISDSR